MSTQSAVHVLSCICSEIDTPVSLGVYLRAKYGEWGQLVHLKLDPNDYCSSHTYLADVTAVSLLQKHPDLPLNIDRKAVAKENFFLSEQQCASTNYRLQYFLDNRMEQSSDEEIYRTIAAVRHEVSYLMGAVPTEDELSSSSRHGPGATFFDKGPRSTILDKMSSVPSLTPSAMAYLPIWSKTAWARNISAYQRRVDVSIISGNRFTTVPKDARRDRGICVEPSVNVYFQLGVGSILKKRLARRGIFLLPPTTQFGFLTQVGEDVPTKHRRLAQQGSRDGTIATIDLKNASDTVAYNVVKLLVPDGWFQVLDSLRSPMTKLDGREYRLAKFSSMGNGFTFELETIIFLAIARVAATKSGCPLNNVSTFGDDIICPTEAVRLLTAMLGFFGFTLNMEKTFVKGPFRESCGGDFFHGNSVRPHFLKESLNVPEEVLRLHNGLYRVGAQYDHDCCGHTDPLFLRKIRSKLRSALPTSWANFGPAELGDAVLTTTDSNRWKRRTKHSITYIRAMVPIVSEVIPLSRWDSGAVYASALYGLTVQTVLQSGGLRRTGIVPRSTVSGFRKDWVAYS